MVYRGKEAEKNALLRVAELMCLAARTAPKGRGKDNIETLILTEEEEIRKLTAEMRRMAEEYGRPCAFFARDAENIETAGGPVVLIGARKEPMGLTACGYCGFASCAEMEAHGATCAFTAGDLGIAIGSAVAVAAAHHADNRIMFSAGRAALNLGFFSPEVKLAYAIPLCAAGKNVFFDRK